MAETELEYDLDEWREWRAGEYCVRRYITVTARDAEGREAYIMTNRHGEGRWARVETGTGLDYRQVLGTGQYSLPKTERGVRRALEREWHELHGPFEREDPALREGLFWESVPERWEE